jgi:hypothetical protein
MPVSIVTLKQGVILFWALWLSLVALKNGIEWLKEIGVLPESWRLLLSGNYAAMREVLGERAPTALVKLLLILVALWEGFAAYLLWRAAFDSTYIVTAFGASLALWAMFMLVDEAFSAYEYSATHLRLFAATLISLMFLF